MRSARGLSSSKVASESVLTGLSGNRCLCWVDRFPSDLCWFIKVQAWSTSHDIHYHLFKEAIHGKEVERLECFRSELLWKDSNIPNIPSSCCGSQLQPLTHRDGWAPTAGPSDIIPIGQLLVERLKNRQQKPKGQDFVQSIVVSPDGCGFKNDNNQENLCRTSTCPKKMSTNEVDQSFASQAILVLHCCYITSHPHLVTTSPDVTRPASRWAVYQSSCCHLHFKHQTKQKSKPLVARAHLKFAYTCNPAIPFPARLRLFSGFHMLQHAKQIKAHCQPPLRKVKIHICPDNMWHLPRRLRWTNWPGSTNLAIHLVPELSQLWYGTVWDSEMMHKPQTQSLSWCSLSAFGS